MFDAATAGKMARIHAIIDYLKDASNAPVISLEQEKVLHLMKQAGPNKIIIFDEDAQEYEDEGVRYRILSPTSMRGSYYDDDLNEDEIEYIEEGL